MPNGNLPDIVRVGVKQKQSKKTKCILYRADGVDEVLKGSTLSSPMHQDMTELGNRAPNVRRNASGDLVERFLEKFSEVKRFAIRSIHSRPRRLLTSDVEGSFGRFDTLALKSQDMTLINRFLQRNLAIEHLTYVGTRAATSSSAPSRTLRRSSASPYDRSTPDWTGFRCCRRPRHWSELTKFGKALRRSSKREPARSNGARDDRRLIRNDRNHEFL